MIIFIIMRMTINVKAFKLCVVNDKSYCKYMLYTKALIFNKQLIYYKIIVVRHNNKLYKRLLTYEMKVALCSLKLLTCILVYKCKCNNSFYMFNF
jgi:hypothetical protein